MDEDGQTDKTTADILVKITQKRRAGNYVMIGEMNPTRKRQKRGKIH